MILCFVRRRRVSIDSVRSLISGFVRCRRVRSRHLTFAYRASDSFGVAGVLYRTRLRGRFLILIREPAFIIRLSTFLPDARLSPRCCVWIALWPLSVVLWRQILRRS